MARSQALTEAVTTLLIQQPFFASLLLDRMKIKEGARLPTAGTDGENIYLNDEFFAKLNVHERVFLLAHEVGHAMLMHIDRFWHYKAQGSVEGMPIDWMLLNAAGDYIINDMLKTAQCGTMPKGGLHDRYIGTHKDRLEDVYKRLLDKKKEQQQQQDQQQGQGGSQGQESQQGQQDQQNQQSQQGEGGQTLDEHLQPEKLETDPLRQQAKSATWERAIREALNSAKATGKMPGSLEEMIDNLLNPQLPWQELLANYMRTITRKGKGARSWRKLNRRKLVYPGVAHRGKSGFAAECIVVAIDTSGSVSSEELRVFLSETASILSEVRPRKLILIQCDTRIADVKHLDRGTDLQGAGVDIKGRGGTQFEPVFDWVKDNGVKPDVLIYLTDMYASFPDAPRYPTIWVSSSKGKTAPFGDTVEISV